MPLERAEVEALAERIRKAGYESVAVGLIHSYLNDAHERMVRDVLAERLPGVMVSISSEVSRRCANTSGSTPSSQTPISSR